MASSTGEYSNKIAPESQVAPRAAYRKANFFFLDLSLRILLFACSVASVVMTLTSKETKLIPVTVAPGQVLQVENSAKFHTSPAFIYLVAAHSVSALYCIFSILASLAAKKYHSNKHLFLLIIIDLLMVGVLASATGSAGSIAYTGFRGNSHARWRKVCNVYETFCRHIGISVGLSLISSNVLLLLVVLSTYTLYRRNS